MMMYVIHAFESDIKKTGEAAIFHRNYLPTGLHFPWE